MARDDRTANYLLLIFGGISLVLMLLPMTGKVRFLRVSLSYLLNPVPFYGSQAYERFANMPADVRRLISNDIELLEARRQLKEAAIRIAESEALRRENNRLRAAVGISSSVPTALRWARIMERDPMNWHRSLMIDAGAESGIQLNAPVLGLDNGILGVVGRISEVTRNTAKVLLLTDGRSEVAAYLPAESSEGLVAGRGRHTLRMNYLPPAAELVVGEQVYSSPTSATFGTDLLIGTITQIFARDPFLQFQSVEVTPAVRPSALKEVLILVPMKAAES